MNRAQITGPQNRQGNHAKAGFTLVELLVVITIIGLLVAIAIPTIRGVMVNVSTTTMKMEVESLVDAIERYQQTYGDYPPDFSSEAVVDRHYRKLFPRIDPDELTLIKSFTGTGSSGANPYNATRIDRAEALVLTLGGYSDDIQRPLTGPGGPLEFRGYVDNNRTNMANYQINPDRTNALMEFQTKRLTMESTGTGANIRYVSTDENGTGNDLFPTYLAIEDGAPFVYFDSRTYGYFAPFPGDFNGWANANNSDLGAVRPYASVDQIANTTGSNYSSLQNAIAAWKFMNANTYQVIAPGPSGAFGALESTGHEIDSGNASTQTPLPSNVEEPVYFQFPSGVAFTPSTQVSTPNQLLLSNVKAYKENFFGLDESVGADNITNFSKGKLIDEVPE